MKRKRRKGMDGNIVVGVGWWGRIALGRCEWESRKEIVWYVSF